MGANDNVIELGVEWHGDPAEYNREDDDAERRERAAQKRDAEIAHRCEVSDRQLAAYGVPEYLRSPVVNYVHRRLHPGHFFERFFSNDLFGCLLNGPADSVSALPRLATFVYSFCSSECWGSKAKFERWLAGVGR